MLVQASTVVALTSTCTLLCVILLHSIHLDQSIDNLDLEALVQHLLELLPSVHGPTVTDEEYFLKLRVLVQLE